ncbi:hypothetical protein IF2G_08357 [Cordyceps javanica]|nr:hypothetical protein IF2G_08357 [Cordyceps javanica]
MSVPREYGSEEAHIWPRAAVVCDLRLLRCSTENADDLAPTWLSRRPCYCESMEMAKNKESPSTFSRCKFCLLHAFHPTGFCKIRSTLTFFFFFFLKVVLVTIRERIQSLKVLGELRRVANSDRFSSQCDEPPYLPFIALRVVNCMICCWAVASPRAHEQHTLDWLSSIGQRPNRRHLGTWWLSEIWIPILPF